MGLVAKSATRSIAVVVVVGVLAACSSSATRVVVPPVPPTSTVPTAANPEREALQFREVEGTIPYAGPTSATTIPGFLPATCENGKLVTPAAHDASGLQIVLPDRARTSCYVMGPVLLTGRTVESAEALVNRTTATWEINVHFANNDFVTKVASREIGRQVAIVLDHVVESAPTIDQGITGQDITISGNFDEATAARSRRSSPERSFSGRDAATAPHDDVRDRERDQREHRGRNTEDDRGSVGTTRR